MAVPFPLVFPLPDDEEFDYKPITEADLRVGVNVLAVKVTAGTVTQADYHDENGEPLAIWAWVIEFDHTTAPGIASYPVHPDTFPEHWWGRQAVWRRAEKLADGATATVGDGSEWIYPAGEDGRVTAFVGGTEYRQGDRKWLGEVLTQAPDVYVAADPEYDWLPITDATDVEVGDVIIHTVTTSGTITGSFTVPYGADGSVTFYNGAAGAIAYPATPRVEEWVFYQRTPKPVVDTKFLGADGARWIYTGGGLYYCWSSGTDYLTGAVFQRGEIAGGLKEIT